MTLAELIAHTRAQLESRLRARQQHTDTLTTLRAQLTADDATEPGPDLTRQIEEAITARRQVDTEVDALQARVTELLAEEERESAIDALQRDLTPTGAPSTGRAYDEVARIGQEKRTYSPDNAREGISFLNDVAGILQGDLDAMERIRSHKREVLVEREADAYVKRDVGTGAFSGITVPVYLTDMIAEAKVAGRNLADNCTPMDLPASGMSVEISRITTGTSADAQSAEGAEVSETDIDDTLLSVPVRMVAGQQDVSRQAIDRSTGSEQVVVRDLYKRYNTALGSQIINADGTSGTHLGIRSTSGIVAVTYTDATPTPSELWGPLWDMAQQIETGTFGEMSHLVMHTRRWAFFCSAIGTNNAMLGFTGVGVQQLGKAESQAYGPGVRGLLGPYPVIVDGNVPTNISSTRDTILGVTKDELFLWEDRQAPLLIRAEQPGAGSLKIKFVVYGYSAFTAGRYPLAHGAINGSGLTTPTFGIAAA